jgi:cyclase
MTIRKRLIPVLLLDRHRRLVKTVRFGERTYIGDPFNVVRLFNEKEVDEILVLDIDATTDGRAPDIGFMKELASECFMPLGYGGGLNAMQQCEQLNLIGVEKFVFGSAATQLSLLRQASDTWGAQAIAVCVDVVETPAGQRCVTRSAKLHIDRTPETFCKDLETAGVGEIILQSVDRDGLRQGMDLALIQSISQQLSVPVVALGGAGEVADMARALKAGASAAASGSAFSFIGRLRAVLINYPDSSSIERLEGYAL